ncbi:MAG: 2Fe-2S iron-sulfur cluster binding domain-containing protein, partial [Spirochaetaceae bacterium]|nr:2Fe-2S iron-sulfur cluster binding domain-containing protein [Spirochaetaceae bacterium]
MEALFCASGISSSEITENGCNCVSCPLYDRCSIHNTAYFCKNGSCAAGGEKEEVLTDSNDCNTYLSRFIEKEAPREETIFSSELSEDALDVTMDFIGEKEIQTKSDIPILEASLAGGIDHTHVCGGRARCSTCRVIVTDGIEHCRPRNEKEAKLAAIKGFSDDVRLACQTTVEG